MHFGYPGENTHLESHGVNEESFWPSFTDVMMVIVMIFLLVTVTVILNNWSLITDLKDSIKAQQIASSLAENTQVQNQTLEQQLSSLENRVESLSEKYQEEKDKQLTAQQELIQSRRLLVEKETRLNALETKLKEQQSALATSNNALSLKQQELTTLQAELSSSNQQKDEKVKAEQLLQEKLTRILSETQQLKQQLSEKEKDATALSSLQSEKSKTQEQLKSLQVDYSKLQTTLKDKELVANKSQIAFAALNAKLEKQNTELQAKDKEIFSLKEKQATDESQLRSLQGEYTSLDAKYQKLLLPARSSKGKYVVSVLYRKTGGRSVIRLKTNAAGTYKTVSESELHKKLKDLKNKHKTNLYLKVIIPQNSGLSYSEAWKFTNGLQNQYDYYYQKNDN